MHELIVLILIGAGTYAMRAGFLLTRNATPPAALTRYLRYIPPAVLAAIVVPALLAPRGTMSVTETLPALAAAALTWLLWRRTEKLVVAMLGGLGLWWVLAAAVQA